MGTPNLKQYVYRVHAHTSSMCVYVPCTYKRNSNKKHWVHMDTVEVCSGLTHSLVSRKTLLFIKKIRYFLFLLLTMLILSLLPCVFFPYSPPSKYMFPLHISTSFPNFLVSFIYFLIQF